MAVASRKHNQQRWQWLRRWVFNRDNHQCQRCGSFGGPLECDHVRPLEMGGTDEVDNLQTLCVGCHLTKTHQENVKRGRYGKVMGRDEWAAFARQSPAQRRRTR